MVTIKLNSRGIVLNRDISLTYLPIIKYKDVTTQYLEHTGIAIQKWEDTNWEGTPMFMPLRAFPPDIHLFLLGDP